MLTRIGRFLAPPIFDDDEEKTTIAKQLNTMTWFVIVMLTLYAILLPVLAPQLTSRLILVLPLYALEFAVLIFARQGHVRFAGAISLTGTWLLLAIASVLSGGVRSPIFAGNVVLILGASIILGRRTAFLFTGLSIALGLILVWAEENLNLPSLSATPMSSLLLQAAYFTIAAAALHFATYSIGEALNRARQEVVERKRLEAQLRDSEERFRRFSDLSSEGILIHDQGKIIDANPALSELSGYSLDELVGKNGLELVAPESRERIMENIVSGEERTVEAKVLRKDGSTATIEVHPRAVPYQGRTFRIVAFRDITEHKREGEEKLLQAARRTALAELSQILAEVSHDYRKVLHLVVERIGELFGDICSVRLISKDGQWQELAAVFHHDPEIVRAVREFYIAAPQRVDEGLGGRVIQTGQGVLMPSVMEEEKPVFEKLAFQKIANQYPTFSRIMVPLRAQGHTIGVLALGRYVSEPVHTQADLAFLQDLADRAALAIANARLYSDLREREQYLTLLSDITKIGSSTLDFSSMLQMFSDRSAEIIHADSCFLTLWDETNQRTIPSAATGPLRQVYTSLPPRPGQPTITQAVMEQRKPLVVEDVLHSPYANLEIAKHLPTQSLLGLPLIAGNQKLGAVLIGFNAMHHFTEEEIHHAEQVANQIALSLSNARLFTETQRRAEEFAALYETTQDLAMELDVTTLLRTIADRATRLLGASRCGIHFYDPAKQELSFVISTDPKAAVGTRLMLGEGLAGKVAEKREPLFVQKYSEWAYRSPKFSGSAVESIVGAPMIYRGELIGVITVGELAPNTRTFNQADARLLSLFASQAASAVHNARLFEEVHLGRRELQVLSRRLLEVQEEERRMLARELHDEVGQALTAVKITLESARGFRKASQREAALKRATGIVQRALDQTRNLSLNLRPSVLDDLGLIPALRWSLDRQAGLNDWKALFVADPLLTRPSAIIEITCFRVAQEALTNVARHAKARHVRVEVRLQEGTQLRLVLQDDGIGFDVPAAMADASRGASLGLLGMHERASLARGRVEITSTPGKGTEVRATFPLDGGSP